MKAPLLSVHISPGAARAEGAIIFASEAMLAGWLTRPVCINCMNIFPPLAWTASFTCFHPFTCSSLNIPGMRA